MKLFLNFTKQKVLRPHLNSLFHKKIFKSMSEQNKVMFKSLIVLDLETTSLPQEDHNTTKITELAVIGCELEHIRESKELPRVLHKLVFLFNPNKKIHPTSTKVTGLSNELLENVKPFGKEDVEVLRHFIDRLPSPVCIIAHNGNKFDFPILRRALFKMNMELQNNVYCADSIEAFRQLLPKAIPHNNDSMTPPHQKIQSFIQTPHKKVARNLFPDDETCFPLSNEEKNYLKLNAPRSYKLNDIYYYFFNGYILNAHSAEEDSKALLNCIIKCDGFFEWINKNSVIFNSIEPLF